MCGQPPRSEPTSPPVPHQTYLPAPGFFWSGQRKCWVMFKTFCMTYSSSLYPGQGGRPARPPPEPSTKPLHVKTLVLVDGVHIPSTVTADITITLSGDHYCLWLSPDTK